MPMPHARGKNRAMDILSIFETGSISPDYSAVAILADGAGLSYGKHQATDKGQALDAIVEAYIAAPGALYAGRLAGYMEQLKADATALVDYELDADGEVVRDSLPGWVVELMEALRDAGGDPIMQEFQDSIFDERYWQPCAVECEAMGLTRALSWALIYDTAIHSGGPGDQTKDAIWKIRKRFPGSPPSGGGDEQEWCRAYAKARYDWLATHPSGARVAMTKARPKAFLKLMNESNWMLKAPFVVNGVTVTPIRDRNTGAVS